ncbi:MAG: hypothetical protein Q8P76_01575 [bacterium]|nr:hypothetical protein [bacterium]
MSIPKIEAAKRQLETAIFLFFKNNEPVSIHTLTRAAHEILETLGKAQNLQSVTQWGMTMIKEEKRKEISIKMNEAKNFFKHADKDADNILNFNTELSNFYLYDSVRLYQGLTKKLPKLFLIFYVWFFMKNPDIFSSEEQKKLFSLPGNLNLDLEDRETFFKAALIATANIKE